MEHKSKGESLEKCQAELKKLRRKSQGSKNPSKYGEKEMQVSVLLREQLLYFFDKKPNMEFIRQMKMHPG